MKKYLTLFLVLMATMCFADYPSGSTENIDGSILGWDNASQTWHPIAVDANGSIFTSDNGQNMTELIDRVASVAQTVNELKALQQSETNKETIKRYGFRIHQNAVATGSAVEYLYDAVPMQPISVSAGTTIANWSGDATSWKQFIYDIAKPVMVKYDGTVDYELDPENQTKRADTGADSDLASVTSAVAYGGNAMVQFRKMYMSVTQPSDSIIDVVFCDKKLDDTYTAWAFTREDGTEADYAYYSMFEGTKDDSDRVRSIVSDGALASVAGNTMKTYCQANGAGWDSDYYSLKNYINMLHILVSRSLDSQASFGDGSTTSDQFVIPGGLGTSDEAVKTGCFYGKTTLGKFPVKSFWIENYWSNRWTWCDGIMLENGIVCVKNKRPYGVASSLVSAVPADYTRTGITVAGVPGNVVGKCSVVNGLMIPFANKYSSNAYKDNMWFNASGVRSLRVGGASVCGVWGGLLGSDLGSALSYSSSGGGCRLSLLK